MSTQSSHGHDFNIAQEARLLTDQDEFPVHENQDQALATFQSRHSYNFSLCTIWLLSLWTSFLVFFTLFTITGTTISAERVYTPLANAIEYENRVFNDGLYGPRTEYMGTPSVESDRAWHDLLAHGMIRLTADEASRMSNKTIPFPSDPEHYFSKVEMWHQLHCVNTLRNTIWAKTPTIFFGRDQDKDARHIDHCLDYLRQVILCHGDVGLMTFSWDKSKEPDPVPHADTLRTCVKYKPLLEWVDADSRRIKAH
ncbi:hypothetical protein ACMFMG_012144 [Clarireedia jacksonii]